MSGLGIQLKRCPFCGHHPVAGHGQIRNAAGKWYRKPFIACTRCGIRKTGDSFDDLVAWWNVRIEVRQ